MTALVIVRGPAMAASRAALAAARETIELHAPLTSQTAVEVAWLQAGGLRCEPSDPPPRPLRAPHYTASVASMAGARGRPGEVSLAHAGVLLLDDLGEWRRTVIEAIACAVEAGSAQSGGVTYPARPLTVVVSALVCPCGQTDCRCPAAAQERYDRRTGSLLARLTSACATSARSRAAAW